MTETNKLPYYAVGKFEENIKVPRFSKPKACPVFYYLSTND